MAAKGDVKAVQITGAAQVFAGRTRLRGIILSNTTTQTTTGSVTLQDESGTQFTAEVPPGDVFSNSQQKFLQEMFFHLTCLKMEFYLKVE
jgi:hypothetical protein